MENLINIHYNIYEIKEQTFASKNFEDAKTKIAINHFITNLIHKLFDNVQSSYLLKFEDLSNSRLLLQYTDLHFENISAKRKLTFDNSSLFNNSDIHNKLHIVTQVPESLKNSFLAVELAILQKAYKNPEISSQLQLSDYAQKLNNLVKSLYSKDITEIEINDELALVILQHQSNQQDQLKEFETQLSHIKKQITSLEKDNVSHQNDIKTFEHTKTTKENTSIETAQKINQLDSDFVQQMKNKFNLIDKLKIAIFETFGVNNVEDLIVQSKIKQNPHILANITNTKNYLNLEQEQHVKEINMISQRITNFKNIIETNKSKIQLLSESLILLNQSQKLLQETTFLASNKDLHHHIDRNLEKISDDQVFSIHVFPNEVFSETTPLKENIDFDERILAIRSLNPNISTSTYRLTGESFGNKTFNKGIIGVLIGRGHISSVHHGDAGTIVNNEGDRETNIFTNFKENLTMLKTRCNTGLDYNEVVVNNSVPYSKIIQLDSLVRRISDDSPEHAFVHVKNVQINTQDWLKEIQHLHDGEREKSFGLNPLPVVLMLNGKLLEIQSINSKFKDDDLIPEKVNLDDFEKVISKKFNIKEIKDLQSIHNTNHDIEKEVRSNIVSNIITKYKSNIVSFIQKDLEEKHNIKLKSPHNIL